MSLGGPRSAAINAAVEIVTKLGVTVIVAAGNNDIDACGTSPASSPYAITVGSHGRDGGRSSFSNRGRCVDLYAPGEHIMSATSPFANAYTLKTGTSMAAPVVAGVVAMLLEQNPRLLPEEVRVMLTEHAKRRVVKGVPGDDRGLAVYAGIVGAPCILETDQECVFVKGLVHESMCGCVKSTMFPC